jgi:hypothetical protein
LLSLLRVNFDERRLSSVLGLLSAALFLVSAWPLALTEVPPYQDLPNHLAAVTVMQHLNAYPEFVFNGFLKTNSALFAWLLAVGHGVGVNGGARLFALLVLGANALVFPRFVFAMTGSRRRTLVACALLWPMVHNWFVSTGMLDFALAVPLSLELLLAIVRQRRLPSFRNGALVVGIGALTWYAHVFPLLVVHMLVGVEVLVRGTPKERYANLKAIVPPLLPVTALVLLSLGLQLRERAGVMSGFVDYTKVLPPWELVYNLWAEWFWGFSPLSVTSIVPCVLLFVLAIPRRYESPPFFSPVAVALLAALYVACPYIATNWFHVNSRLIPYLWIAMLLRVPSTLSRKTIALLSVSAVLYSVGMAVDYVRLEKERREFVAGIPAVPEHARLLPLLFRHTGVSDNTRSILHHWGYYVTEKQTSAPLLFAHSRSFPIMYREPPAPRFNHLPLEGFARSAAHSTSLCKRLFDEGLPTADCDALYRLVWRSFWAEAEPLYDHVLTWDATEEARALIPSTYRLLFQRGRLAIYGRTTELH